MDTGRQTEDEIPRSCVSYKLSILLLKKGLDRTSPPSSIFKRRVVTFFISFVQLMQPIYLPLTTAFGISTFLRNQLPNSAEGLHSSRTGQLKARRIKKWYIRAAFPRKSHYQQWNFSLWFCSWDFAYNPDTDHVHREKHGRVLIRPAWIVSLTDAHENCAMFVVTSRSLLDQFSKLKYHHGEHVNVVLTNLMSAVVRTEMFVAVQMCKEMPKDRFLCCFCGWNLVHWVRRQKLNK